MKRIFTICAILIAFSSYSQDTIQITTNQAKQAILNAQKVERMEVIINSQSIIISNLESYKKLYENEKLINELLRNNNNTYKKQIKIERSSELPTFLKVLIVLGSFGLGLLL